MSVLSEPENADEGESHGDELLPPSVAPVHDAIEAPYASFRGRAKRARLILLGKDVAERITSDPESRIRQARAHQENRWRDIYAFFLLIAMLGQVGFADWFFWHFAAQNKWGISDAVIIAFFSSVVVEVIGLVLVITQSLFSRSKDSAGSSH